MTKRGATLALALVAAGTLRAHDLVVRTEVTDSAVIVRAAYDGGDPASNADVSIYRPDEPDALFQQGRSDRNGAFAFVPDAPGDWRVEVDDGFGHRLEHTVATGAGVGKPSVEPAAGPRWRDALTGVSLLIGATGLLLWRRSKA